MHAGWGWTLIRKYGPVTRKQDYMDQNWVFYRTWEKKIAHEMETNSRRKIYSIDG